MPETRDLALGAWTVALLGVAWRGGFRSLLSTVLLGAGPAVMLATMFSDALKPITGLYSKKDVEEAEHRARGRERRKDEKLTEGGESMEWLNCLVKQLWPHVAKYVEDMIIGYESMIQGYLPVVGSSLKFSACSLGKRHLEFGPVKPRLVDASFGGATLESNGVELEIDISYNSDVDIVLSSPIASVGIADLKINGTLSVIFRPLLSERPFIGGMEVLFTNPPEIDLDFKGIGNVADLPGVYTAVRNVINDAIAGIMVAPNRKAFAISGDPAVDLAYLKNPSPEGMLRVTVVKAENLEGTEMNFNMTKTSDPFVQVRIGSTEWRTPTIKANCNPVWSEKNVQDFFFFSSAQLVQIDVWDEDKLSAHDSLGRVRRRSVQELLDMSRDGAVPLPLEQRTAQDSTPPEAARVHLRFEALRLVPPDAANLEEGSNRYFLALKIDECDGLPEAGLEAPYTLRLTHGQDTTRSLSTKKGWAKYAPVLTAADIRRLVKLLEGGLEPKVVADVMGLEQEDIKALAAENLPSGSTDAKLAEWSNKLEAARAKREASTNPQFEEVLRLPVPERGFTAVVELLNSRKTPVMVGRCEVQIGNTDTIDGPFVIQDPQSGKPLSNGNGQEAKLHGHFKLHGLAR